MKTNLNTWKVLNNKYKQQEFYRSHHNMDSYMGIDKMKTLLLLFFGVGHIDNIAGTEKVFVNMANAFSQRGYEVIAICNDSPEKKLAYKLSKEVVFINLGLGKITVPIERKILREVLKPFQLEIDNPVDVYRTEVLASEVQKKIKNSEIYCAVCFEYNSIMVANKLAIKPRIAMVHNSIEELIKPMTKKQLEQANKMDAYQVLMPNFVEEAKRYLSTRVIYIPNAIEAVVEPKPNALEKQNKEKNKIICIGRLAEKQKRQHILLEAFALLATKYPKWEVDFYGPDYDKGYKAQLCKLINKYKLEKQVNFKGVTDNVPEKMRQADILAIPSAYEGFAMVLGEAMSVGLPAVGFANATSVKDLIINNENGILCADTIKDYAIGLEKLMCNEQLRRRLGENAKILMQEYSADKVWNKWEHLFEQLHQPCNHL